MVTFKNKEIKQKNKTRDDIKKNNGEYSGSGCLL